MAVLEAAENWRLTGTAAFLLDAGLNVREAITDFKQNDYIHMVKPAMDTVMGFVGWRGGVWGFTAWAAYKADIILNKAIIETNEMYMRDTGKPFQLIYG